MNLTPHLARDLVVGALATAGAFEAILYFPEAAVITKLALLDETGVAADGTTIVTVTATDLGVAGAGSTVIGVVTTDSDLADTAARKSAALVAKVPLVLDLGSSNALVLAANGHVSGYEVAAGSAVKVALANASGLTLDAATITVCYRPGQN